jgi:glycosyltransferase involved in cell wall biosynthesis
MSGPLNILLMTQYYWPEDYAAGHYMQELAEGLAARGHAVTVLTAFPHHPEGVVPAAYRGRGWMVEERGGVRIVRSWIYAVPRHRAVALRALSHLSVTLSTLVTGLSVSRPDVIYALGPLLPFGYAARAIRLFGRAPLVFGVKDLTAEALVQSGKLGEGAVLGLIKRVERRLYASADRVQVASPAHHAYLREWGIPEDRLSLIHDWADPGAIRPGDRFNEFRQELGIGEGFLVLYSGNMGYASDLETVVEAAAGLVDLADVHFVMIGDGARRPGLEQRAAALGLPRMRFLDFQPRERLGTVLAAADLCLLTLNRRFTRVSGQGKMYNIMAAARPMLAVMEREALGVDLIERKGLGWRVDPGDPAGLAQTIRSLRTRTQELAAAGARGREVLEREYSVGACTTRFEEMFRSVVARGRR